MNYPDFPEAALSAPELPSSENLQTRPIGGPTPKLEVPVSHDGSDLKSLYGIYSQDPTPNNLFKVVNRLSPLIGNTLAQLGEGDNALLKNEAMLMTADAVRTFNPEQGATLQTWAGSQLKQLRRKRREFNSVVKLPERVQLDAFHIERGMRELTDMNGEEPDVEQLSDHIKMPIKRIAKVRSMLYKTPDSGAISSDGINQTQTDNTEEAMHYIYNDAGKIDRKIMEHRLGYGGSKALSNNELAKLLEVGPDVISKRLSRILKRVDSAYNILSR